MNSTIKELLINNNINQLIIDKLTDLLLDLKGQNFAEFIDMIDDFFWTIANDNEVFEEPEPAYDYCEENIENFLQIGTFSWIKEFWGVQNLADLPCVKISNYMLAKIEENKINKIDKTLFNLINQ